MATNTKHARLLVILAVLSGLPKSAHAQYDLNTVDGRLLSQIQENIDDPWPGISDPNNAPGVFSYALACLYLNQNVSQANQLLFDFYTNNPIPETQSGRDDWNGYFWQHILWRAYHDPTSGSRMTTQARDLIEDNMWRWLVNRSKITEAEQNVWMIYDSENHDAMTKGSHLMCLLALKSSPRYGPDVVLADGGTIAEHLSAWTAFYMRYFRARAQEGINVEIACQQYAKYTVGAYYNIMDFSDSPDLRELAKTFIDLYWADTASDWLSSGVRGGGQTRCYREGGYLRNGNYYSFHGLTWAYGWHQNTEGISTYMLIPAVSPYRVPEIITACATDPNRPDFLYTSRRFGRGGNWDSNKNYTVVFDNGDSNIRRETYVTPDYSMGGFALDMNKDYIALIDQNRVMGVMFAAGVNERIMIFGKGGSNPTVSFADINGVTREQCMVVQRDKNAYSGGNATQLYVSPQAWANRAEVNGWFFTQVGNAYCAIKPANGGYTAAAAGSGMNLTLDDLWAPVVFQMGQAADYANFAAFQTSVQANALTYSSGTMNYTSEAGDTFTFYANSKTTPKVNGITVDLNPTKTYDSPYLSMVHGGEIATFSYTGYPDLTLDFGYDPDISLLSPRDNATGVFVDTNLVATFNEPVQAGTGFITIRKVSDDSVFETFDVSSSPRLAFGGSALTIDPTTDFDPATSYYVTIDSTAVEDLAGKAFAGISGNAAWNFTTSDSVFVWGWNYAPWTGDGDSGISSNHTYTAKHCFGDNHGGSVTVNGVTFTENFNTSGTGWSISGTKSDWNGDDDAAITGASEDLAEEFVFSGNPRTVTFNGLTPGTKYRATFYSVGWGATGRSQTFQLDGGVSSVISQETYGSNQGIRILCVYEATGTSQGFTITPLNASQTFHLYALDNREEQLAHVPPEGFTVVATGSSEDAAIAASAGGKTISINAGAADFLIVGTSTEFGSGTGITATYDGNPMTFATGNGSHSNLLYLDLTQTTYTGGNANLTFTWDYTAGGNLAVGWVSLEANLDAGETIELHSTAFADSTTGTVDLVTTVGNTFNFVNFNGNKGNAGSVPQAPLIEIYSNGSFGSNAGAAGYETNVAAGSHAYSWNHDILRRIDAAAFAVVPASGGNEFSDWIAGYPELGEWTDLADDPDGDGIPNAIEAVFGTHPGETSQGLTNVATNRTTTTFTHPISDNPPGDLTLIYQWSTNLVDWYACDGVDGPLSGETVSVSSETVDTTTTVTATASESMDGLFLRAGVTQP